jgi:hypothetical protein
MLSYLQLRALIEGILLSHPETKKETGRRIAAYLGFTPGPRGPDDGIDGLILDQGRKIHFQCKLAKHPLDKDGAREYYSDLKYHGVCTSILLSGVGFKDTFRERLFGHPDIASFRIHLLTLEDLFQDSPAFRAATQELPGLAGLAEVVSGPHGKAGSAPGRLECPPAEGGNAANP